MYKRWMPVLLALALLIPATACAKGAYVTAQSYENIPFELTGQRAFVLPDYEADVYDAVLTDEQSRIAFDIYPYEALGDPPAFALEAAGAPIDGFSCHVSPIAGADGYGYLFSGPGLDAKPDKIRVVSADRPDSAFVITLREHEFTRFEPAYYFRAEIHHVGVPDRLRGAEDIVAAAADYLPGGARLIDCYVAEDYASIHYQVGNTRVTTDYYEDGHVEKMLRAGTDERVFFASTARERASTIDLNDRQSLARYEEMRPPRKKADAIYRSSGITFKVDGYRFDEDVLLIDWSASSRREGLVAMLGSFDTSTDRVADVENTPYASLFPCHDIVRLSGERTAFKGVQGMIFGDEEGMPREPFDVTMTLHICEPLVPIESLEGIAPRTDTPSLIEFGDTVSYVSTLEVDEDGSTSGEENLVQDYVNEHGHEDEDYLYALEAFGYLKPIRTMKLTFTVEP